MIIINPYTRKRLSSEFPTGSSWRFAPETDDYHILISVSRLDGLGLC